MFYNFHVELLHVAREWLSNIRIIRINTITFLVHLI